MVRTSNRRSHAQVAGAPKKGVAILLSVAVSIAALGPGLHGVADWVRGTSAAVTGGIDDTLCPCCAAGRLTNGCELVALERRSESESPVAWRSGKARLAVADCAICQFAGSFVATAVLATLPCCVANAGSADRPARRVSAFSARIDLTHLRGPPLALA
jgi:hypothetical protein